MCTEIADVLQIDVFRIPLVVKAEQQSSTRKRDEGSRSHTKNIQGIIIKSCIILLMALIRLFSNDIVDILCFYFRSTVLECLHDRVVYCLLTCDIFFTLIYQQQLKLIRRRRFGNNLLLLLRVAPIHPCQAQISIVVYIYDNLSTVAQ